MRTPHKTNESKNQPMSLCRYTPTVYSIRTPFISKLLLFLAHLKKELKISKLPFGFIDVTYSNVAANSN